MFSILKCSGGKIQTKIFKQVVYRRYMKISENMEILLRKADKIPQDFSLIYRHRNYKLTTFLYHTVNITSCFAFAVTIHFFYYGQYEKLFEGQTPMFKHTYEPYVVAVFSIGMLLLATLLRSQYAIRIYRSEKTNMCRAIYIGKVPFMYEFYDFPNHSLKYVKKNSMLPWYSTIFNANGRKIMLFDNKFRSPHDFNQLFHEKELQDN